MRRPAPPDGPDEEGADPHERVARMRREGRLTDEEAHRAHRLIDAGRYDELGTLLRANAARQRGSKATGFTLLRVLVALTAAVVLVDFVVGLL
ncbi:MAG: hypothetical protein ABEH40_06490 [Haloferacaceae archaeon]